jgi:hypothetical protein
MLIKYWDRLTIDGFLAARAARRSGDHSPFKELLKIVTGGLRPGELPFSADPAEAVRFTGGTFLELEPDQASLCSSIADLKNQPDDYSSFLLGEAHETLPLSAKAIVTGLFPRAAGGPRLLSVHEGRTGRKYARTKSATVNFLMHHPAKDDLLSEIATRYRLDSELRTAAQLEGFLGDDGADGRVDELIDAAAGLKGYLFDAKAFGPEIADKSAWLFEFDKKSRATLDFVVHPARGYAAVIAPLADAERDLAAALKDALAFAKSAGISADAGGFVGALRILEDGLPSPRPFWKLCGLDADRQRLLAAALASDQFAVPGSWNGVAIEKDSAYRRVSNRAVFCLVQAVCAAAG